MLLSLLKILFFFAVVLVIALGAVQLSETGQMLRIEYAGTEYALTPVKAVVALLILMASDLNSTRSLGPVAATGVAFAWLAALTLLPALLRLARQLEQAAADDHEIVVEVDVEVAAAPDRDTAAGRAHLDRFAEVAALEAEVAGLTERLETRKVSFRHLDV